MKVTVGIDIGGSTTKIVGFDENKNLINPMFVKAADPLTSIYGAFGKFTSENALELTDIEKVMITGVGSTYVKKPIYGLLCEHVPEFESVAYGGLYLSGLQDAIVVSMGTGTSLTHGYRTEDGKYAFDYLGGTGVGGGTISGLSKKLYGMSSVTATVELAKAGDLEKIDLQIKDMTQKDILPGLPKEMTASNFGKVSDFATREDCAAGLVNLVLETVAMLAIFAARGHGIKDIVLTGNLTVMPQAKEKFDTMSEMFGVNFIIPDKSQFATVIGAAMKGGRI